MQDEPSPGTHLTTKRRGYVHHGLYAGESRVIHYAGYSRWFRRGPVEEVTLDQFSRGKGWQVEARSMPRYSGPAAVERARARLGENHYSLLCNNCEHFVEWCISGTPRSAQVDAFAAGLRARLGALASLLKPLQPSGMS